MKSIVEDLIEKIRLNPSLLERSGPRQDLGLLLFSRREALDALWKAADRAAPLLGGEAGGEAGAELGRAVEELRPLFGER